MNYNETVGKVMGLLEERRVCLSSRKSHEACHESFGAFLNQRDAGE